MVFLCKATGGELDFGTPYNRARLSDFLNAHEGEELKLEKHEPKRTGQQNKYYWLYLGIVERETGNESKKLHEFFKKEYAPVEKVVVSGKLKHEFLVSKSTSDMTKLEFGDYLEKICATTGVPLPDPEQAGFIMN